jgi:hypothetical protein
LGDCDACGLGVADFSCGFGGVFSIRFSVSLNFFSSGLGVGVMGDRASKALDKFATTLGHVTIKYNEAQAFVLHIFINLSGAERHVARAMFFSMKSDAGQRDMTIAMARSLMVDDDYKETAECKQVVSAIEGLSKLAGERNAAIHTMWYLDSESVGDSPPDYWFIPDPNSIAHPRLQDDAEKQFKALIGTLGEAKDRLFLATLPTFRFHHSSK